MLNHPRRLWSKTITTSLNARTVTKASVSELFSTNMSSITTNAGRPAVGALSAPSIPPYDGGALLPVFVSQH